MGEPAITFQASYYGVGGNQTPRRKVIHATCPPLTGLQASAPGQARSTARYFTTAGAGGSAHNVTDPGGLEHCVRYCDRAYHAPPNAHSLGYEVCGQAWYSRDQWLTGDPLAAMQRTAAQVRQDCLDDGTPMVKIGPAELLAGRNGICGHVDVTLAWRQSDHTDPGPGFPWDVFMRMVTNGAGPAPGPAADRLLEVTDPLMQGPDVAVIQDALNRMHYDAGVMDGYYGEGTKAAVIRFQQAKGLDADGVVGPATRGAIFAAIGSDVVGGIGTEYRRLGGAQSPLGMPASPEMICADRVGRFVLFDHGTIYWTPVTDAHEVRGAIRDTYNAIHDEQSVLGYPITGETTAPDGVGRFNHFQNGSIYWTAKTGARVVRGAIRAKWGSLGWECGLLGYPVTDETGTPDGVGSYNHFEHGSVYWNNSIGAHEVHGAIRDAWASGGWERGPYGYPTCDEFALPGGRGQEFQRGVCRWSAASGVTWKGYA